MGYSTDFYGSFSLDKRLAPKHANYLRKFSNTRRMRRNNDIAKGLPDPAREAAGLPLGTDGEYFVGGEGFAGQDMDASVVEFNDPPSTQPSLWCHWEPTSDDMGIAWDGSEKFYDYVEWIQYINDNFLKKWGYQLSGSVQWQGENKDDAGWMIAKGGWVMEQAAELVPAGEGDICLSCEVLKTKLEQAEEYRTRFAWLNNAVVSFLDGKMTKQNFRKVTAHYLEK